MFDLIVKNGRIIDGSGKASYVADIGVSDDKIDTIGNLADAPAKDTIDASGLLVMPGFIDSHTHSDMALLFDRQHANGLHQGITCEILGQDGLSCAPLSGKKPAEYAKFLSGLNGYYEDIPLDFHSVEEYLVKLHKNTAVNAAYQLPHGAIRFEALGFVDEPLTGFALDKAKDVMRKGFEDGAVAFSTGLSYYPCAYSDTEELVELCRVCAEYDSPFVVHTRTVFRGKPFDPVLEAIEVARKSGCRLHFSHLRTSQNNAGRTDKLLEPIENALAEGIKITCETYPYYSGSGYAVVFLPLWAAEGGYQAMLDRLSDPKLRPAIAEGVRKCIISPEGIFTHLPKNGQYIGMDFRDVAEERGQSVEDMLCDLLLEEDLNVGYMGNPPVQENVLRQLDRDLVVLLSRPYYMIGSDSIPLGFKPHPRAFGTFPRFLRLCRDLGMTYELFANRASALPAKTFALAGRGYIREGYFADLVVVDKDAVTDNATYKNPRRAPDGILHVVVNGKIELYNEKVTGLLNGYAVKKKLT